MSTLDELWDRIDTALEKERGETIVDIIDQAIENGGKEGRQQHEFYYAAGYVAYMHPEGKRNAYIRKKSEDAFMLSLFCRSGFLPSVLYLAFIKMDEMRYLNALELLYSYDRKVNVYDEQLLDRYYEATICCLIECGFWEQALKEMGWFERRKEETSQVGLDLINFMKIIEKIDPVTETERSVIKEIKVLVCDFF